MFLAFLTQSKINNTVNAETVKDGKWAHKENSLTNKNNETVEGNSNKVI